MNHKQFDALINYVEAAIRNRMVSGGREDAVYNAMMFARSLCNDPSNLDAPKPKPAEYPIKIGDVVKFKYGTQPFSPEWRRDASMVVLDVWGPYDDSLLDIRNSDGEHGTASSNCFVLKESSGVTTPAPDIQAQVTALRDIATRVNALQRASNVDNLQQDALTQSNRINVIANWLSTLEKTP